MSRRYSAGAEWQPRVWTAPIKWLEASLVPASPAPADRLVACDDADASPECAVLRSAAETCAPEPETTTPPTAWGEVVPDLPPAN